MDLSEKRARWSQMLAQAADFADADNTAEAVARAKACLREIDDALTGSNGDARTGLERERKRATDNLHGFERTHEEWRTRVAERSARYTDNERKAYVGPLAKKGLA